MKLHYLRQTLLLALLLLTAQLGWSQGATTAAMSGTITDAKGQVLPGATVIAVHTPTNTQYVSPTNADGRFNIQNMRVGGPYTVKVTFVGFQDFTRTGINLTLAENFRLDAKLGESTTQLAEVTVTGSQNPIINADRTGAATTVQRQQIERLPTINRSFNDFTRLTPQGSGTNTQSFAGRNNLYNNLTIDGAIFNNAFGLSSTIGGQASAQPVSLDAIDQIQVSLAPYDVRQGSFTGAGINAVTRSGTNKFSASVYDYYRNQNFVGQNVGSYQAAYPNFNLNNIGFRLGGPIVKDKLFFFVNFEQEKRTDPPSGNYTATRANVTSGPQTSQANAADLDALSAFLMKQYGYNPGAYENYSLRSNSYKATAKLDWNINNNNHFNIKYNYLKSYADINPSSSGGSIGGSRAETAYGLPFFSSYYTINNNLNSIIAELNSTLGGGKYSNNVTAGYIGNRDYREYPAGGSPFPMVDIGNQVGLTPSTSTTTGVRSGLNSLTTFGSELYSAYNVLNSDIYQFGDNFTAFLGKHSVTLGTYDELYKFSNGYAPNYYGTYQYNSLEDFYASAGYTYDRNSHQVGAPYTGSPVGAARYALQYSTQAGFPYAVTKAAQLGFYVQDEYTPTSNLKLTLGLRGDIPIIFSDIDRNPTVSGAATEGNGAGPGALTFRNGVQFSTSQLPARKLLFSPRIGFNWDVNDDKKTQVRGGTGIFTGRVPFVWISNQAGNNGVQFNSIDVSGSGTAGATYVNSVGVRVPYTFNPDVNAYRPAAGGGSTSYSLAVTDKSFKFPQVWRSNFAVDQVLPGGVVATVEGLYTKDINAMYIQNVDLPVTTNRAAPVGTNTGDQRPIFYTTNPSTGLTTTTKYNRIYNPSTPTIATPVITDAELLTNTSLGYSYSITGQLSKSFSNGLFASLAYTYSDSRSVNDGNSSVAYSNWSARQVSGDPNANVLSYSQWLTQHRVIASLSYRHEYLSHLATTFSMFYDGEPTGRFSYVYNGDMNGDGVTNNDLMYIPLNQSEINLAPISTTVNGTAVVYSAQQQWTDLNNFINQDPYLSKHRGQYAERNGAVYPWQHRIDVKMIQDIFTNIGENRNTLQFSVDVFNIGNLLNRNWGAFPTTYKTNPLNFVGYNAQNQPIFSYGYYANPSASSPTGTVLTDTYRANTGSISSRWQIQLGLRYIFN
ncbi:TonB-dependent receptor [Hymenobacter baengnokdamensis]|uniref:TonB-dependent receptor n=1 Tax=Hymenobacter baengnokdamensis TaxID=2615203 RepID=UPI001248CB4F|nr:TonB-dependent receptor [Hymenobacter baengnokdamensis]